MFGRKKSNFFDDFDTDFDSRSDTSDDNNVREFGFVVDQHISDHFDDKRVVMNAQLWAIIQLVYISD